LHLPRHFGRAEACLALLRRVARGTRCERRLLKERLGAPRVSALRSLAGAGDECGAFVGHRHH